MTDFERIAERVFPNSINVEKDYPYPGDEEFRAIEGCISIWDENGDGTMCIALLFNPDGSFKEIFIND